LEIDPDPAETDHCGSCRACLDICPTDAFPAPYQLDARRCLAYLSIEHAGPIPEAFRKPMGNRVFGCDDCLAVCPWNRFAQPVADARMALKDDLDDPPLLDLLALDDAAFRKRFAGTPVKRTGRDRFLRNVVIAAGNATHQAASERARLVAGVRARLEDESPLVRGMAVWALDAIGDNDGLAEARKRAAFREHDAHVRAEWRAAGFECEGES
ncbi:MAG: tRNA epoxyqueuosine(34) reductase QueG, partial [Pseudomonadota bacterium]